MFGNLGHFGAKAQQCGSMGGLNRQMTQITYVKDIILDQEWWNNGKKFAESSNESKIRIFERSIL